MRWKGKTVFASSSQCRRSVVDDALTWSRYIDHMPTKIARGVGFLNGTRSFLPKRSLLTLYQSMIEPYFRYCSVVRGQCNESLVDRLHTL